MLEDLHRPSLRDPQPATALVPPSECGSIFMFDSWLRLILNQRHHGGVSRQPRKCVCRLLLCYRNADDGIERKFSAGCVRWLSGRSVRCCQMTPDAFLPYHSRGMAYNFTAIEKKWQQYWLENKTFRALDPADAGDDAQGVRAGHVPLPQRRRPARRAPRGLHRHRHRLPVSCGCRAATCCTRWAGTRSACPPSSTRSRPTRTRAETTREEHRELPPADPDAGPELRLGPRGRYHRPGVLQVDAVDLPAAVQQLLRPDRPEGQADRAPDERAGEREPTSSRRTATIQINPTQEGHGGDRRRGARRARCGASCRPTSSATSSTASGWRTWTRCR